jgi:protein-tyrosine phosphatase
MLRILCVCTGNTCRSPMAAALFRRDLAAAGVEADVGSAGTAAGPGEPASGGAQRAMARRGLDLSGHRSRPISACDLAAFDRIYTVSTRHAAFVRAQGVPAARIAVLAAEAGGVPDPFGGDDAEYETCAASLEAEVRRIVAELSSPR